METLKFAIMSVIRSKGSEIDEKDFVQYFSYMKNWMPPAMARKLFRTCVDAKLLVKKGEKYVPNFEPVGTIPLDFKITEDMVEKYTIPEDLFTVMLDKICSELNISRKNALIEINRIKREAIYITIEVATLIYCKIKALGCEEYYDTVEKKLVVV